MKHLNIHSGSGISAALTAGILLLTVFLMSCRVTLTAPYDESLVNQTQQIVKQVDKLYLTMLETTENENDERAFGHFAEDYINIEVELNYLLIKNRMKPLNSESVRNYEIALETWVKYKEMHKKNNGISDADIELNRDYLRDLFIVILIGEDEKSKIR